MARKEYALLNGDPFLPFTFCKLVLLLSLPLHPLYLGKNMGKKLERREELNTGRQKTVSRLITYYLTDRNITGPNRLSIGLKGFFLHICRWASSRRKMFSRGHFAL